MLCNSVGHPSAANPTVAVIWSFVQVSAAQKLESQVLVGGIQEELATVEMIASVPGMFRHEDAGELIRELKVLWQPLL